ncbi:MAG: heavy-metal-associated domain-containing protein [Maritimibacter sp.]
MRILIPDMTCDHCKAKIEDAVLDLDEGAAVRFDMGARQIEVETVLDHNTVIGAINDAGYDATVQD